MTNQELLVDNHDLLSFAGICHVSLVIDTSRIVPCTRPVMHTSRQECHLDWRSSQFASGLRKVALDERSDPATIHSLVYEVFVQREVPEVSVVTGNKSQGVLALCLHPFYSPLARAC